MKRMLGMTCLLLAMLLPVSALACEHNFGPWKTKTSATCTRQGHQFKYCLKCDHWEQRRTPKLPHTPGEMTVTKEPTCTETGKQEAVCQVCNNLVRYNMKKLPHAYGEMVVTQEPTCVRKGTGAYTCADCGQVKKENLPKLGHDWGEVYTVKEPTCKTTGTGEQSCQRCDAKQTTKIDRLEHVYGEWTVTREPEGKRKGVRESACTLCGKTRQEHFFWEGTLYEGMERCEEVIRMQEKLRDLGYYKGTIRSGQFGELTTAAVARFQADNGMDDSGIADTATLDCLSSAWEAATGKSAAPALDEQEMENAQQAQPIAG